jgi:hypothetical protein
MDHRAVTSLLERGIALDGFLRDKQELSLALDSESLFKKAFIVACGSYCERQITDTIHNFASHASDPRLSEFVRTRALERRYHDLFDWSALNANRFWGFFGGAFKDETIATIKATPSLEAAMRSFMEIGQLRNQVAHTYSDVNKTIPELRELLDGALCFLEFVGKRLATAQPSAAEVGAAAKRHFSG